MTTYGPPTEPGRGIRIEPNESDIAAHGVEGQGLGSGYPRRDERLLEELKTAEQANMHTRTCQVCDALSNMTDQARAGVSAALAGTIGERKLAEILTRNGYPTGRRAVANHRSEGHS